jgi:diguanylate cyclase (GGDEF)-like protein
MASRRGALSVSERLSRLPIRATAVYAVLAVAWIGTSDRAITVLGLGATAQTLKGWAFVLVSSVALYSMLRTMVQQIRRSDPGHDSLTRLPNRALFTTRLGHAITRAGPDHQMVAVVALGLDRFRGLNDTLGQGSGDEALLVMVGRFEATLRTTDILARIGGDEFGILIHHPRQPHDVSAAAQRVLQKIAAPFTIRGAEVRLTASAGVALFPADGQTAEELLKNADLALTRAKQEGRNTWRFFVPSMDQAARERAAIETGLHRALDQSEFLLHYQPQVDLGSGKVVGVEALLRWNRPGEGVVAPGRFLPIAEEIGIIQDIGAWVVETAATRAARWRRDHVEFGRISVNISFAQFRRRDLDRDIRGVLERTGLPPGHLELELTESVLAREADRAVELVGRLHDLGVSLSIDDFGTGYSSLSYLRQFRVHLLKIDRSFVAGIGQDRGSETLVRTIIGLANSLGLRTVAEGVETAAQAEFLRDAGCDIAQGYYFCIPLEESALLKFLHRGGAS